MDAALLCLILRVKYSINECNLKRSKAVSCIFYKKDDDGKLELVISVHIDDVFIAGHPERLYKIKWKINLKVNIQESGKVKNILGVYYE